MANHSSLSLEHFLRDSAVTRLRRLVSRQDLELRHLRRTAADVDEEMGELERLQPQTGPRGKDVRALMSRQGVELRRVRKTMGEVERLGEGRA